MKLNFFSKTNTVERIKNFGKALRNIKKLPSLLNKKEFFIFLLSIFLIVTSIILLFISFYNSHTKIVPAYSGIFKEGIVGQPRFINPLYADNNDPDRDISELVFSGLMKYDPSGKIVLDSAKDYEIKENGKVYEVELKKNIRFHDGKPLTADDVIFTIKTIQNPEFKSPLIKRWLGVEVEKISDYKIRFILRNPYPEFLENLTVKILPAHIWKNISAENFSLSSYNLKPVGSGPYKFESLEQDSSGFIRSIVLSAYKNYSPHPPYIQKIKIVFFKKQEDLIAAAKAKLIDGFSIPVTSKLDIPDFKLYNFHTPRYFALFFNLKNNNFSKDKDLRLALNYIIDRKEIIEKIFNNKGLAEISPFLPDIFHFPSPEIKTPDFQKASSLLERDGFKLKDGKWVKEIPESKMSFSKDLDIGAKGKEVENLQKCLAKFPDIYPEGEITGYFGKKTKEAVTKFQEKYSEEILKPSGLNSGNGRVGPATRKKLNQICLISPAKDIPLTITITTGDEPVLVSLANNIKDQLDKFGIETHIKTVSTNQLKQNIIKERDYEILLFGQVLGILPDPFAFWHSSQREYPGLNLSNYQSKKLDSLLEEIRTESDSKKKIDLLEKAQDIFLNDMPAIILGSPDFLYWVNPNIKNIERGIIITPSQRFNDIIKWYIKTHHVFSK